MAQRGLRGWILHPKDVFGVPDFFFKKSGLSIFVDGCFWHGCPRCGHVPKTNTDYWARKIERNRARDKEVEASLEASTLRFVRFWECEIRTALSACVDRIASELASKPRRKRGRKTISL